MRRMLIAAALFLLAYATGSAQTAPIVIQGPAAGQAVPAQQYGALLQTIIGSSGSFSNLSVQPLSGLYVQVVPIGGSGEGSVYQPYQNAHGVRTQPAAPIGPVPVPSSGSLTSVVECYTQNGDFNCLIGANTSANGTYPAADANTVAIGYVTAASGSTTVTTSSIAPANALFNPLLLPGALGVNGAIPSSYTDNYNTPMYPGAYMYTGNEGLWLGSTQPADGIYVGTYNPATSGDSIGHHRVFWAQPAFGVTTGSGSVFIGTNAGGNGDNSTQGGNYFMGGGAAQNLTTGHYNEGIGAHCLSNMTTGYQNVCMGVNAGASITDGNQNTILGSGGFVQGDPSNVVAIGNNVATNASGSPQYDVLIGGNVAPNIAANQDTIVGDSSGSLLTTGVQDTFLGGNTGQQITTGSFNTFGGFNSGVNATAGNFDTYYGVGSGSSSSSTESTCAGLNCLAQASGNLNAAMGYDAGTVVSSGNNNSLFGSQAGFSVTTGYGNTLVGSTVSSISSQAVTTGNQNIMIGYNVAVPSATATGQLSIANAIFGLNNTAQDANVSTGCIGIYNRACSFSLDLTGTFRASGAIVAGGGVYYNSTNTTGGTGLNAGAGAPTGACQSGSLYVRTDASAAAGATTYDCRASAWFALSGG